MSESIWVEKYRPTSLDQFVGNEVAIQRLKGMLDKNAMTHLLLAGPPGNGKTSAMHCVARRLLGDNFSKAVLELNAADERGIDVVREKIKNFAREHLALGEGQTKIVMLDEVDSMTDAAQQALRRLMEVYSDSTRFALACNQSDKVIEPIQSRCAILRFARVSGEQMKMKLREICRAESMPFEEEALQVVVDSAEGDMRRAIGAVQAAAAINRRLEIPSIYYACDVPPTNRIQSILTSLQKGTWRPAHDTLAELLAEGYSCQDVLRAMKNIVLKSDIQENRRHACYKEIVYASTCPDRHRMGLLGMDRLLCRMCQVNVFLNG